MTWLPDATNASTPVFGVVLVVFTAFVVSMTLWLFSEKAWSQRVFWTRVVGISVTLGAVALVAPQLVSAAGEPDPWSAFSSLGIVGWLLVAIAMVAIGSVFDSDTRKEDER